MIVSALTLDERMRRAEREGKRLAADVAAGKLRGPYKIVVDFVASCKVMRDMIVDTEFKAKP